MCRIETIGEPIPNSNYLPACSIRISSLRTFLRLLGGHYYPPIIYDRIREKGPFHTKCIFSLPLFKLSPFQGLKNPWLLTWFIGLHVGLLLCRSNVRSYGKPPVPSGEPPKWGIKQVILEVDWHACILAPHQKWAWYVIPRDYSKKSGIVRNVTFSRSCHINTGEI